MKGKTKHIITYTINLFISVFTIFIPKTNKIWIFGSWSGVRFSDNSRYMFLYAQKNKKELELDKVIWITKSDSLYKELNTKGYEVYKYWSLKSIWYHLRAGIHFIDQGSRRDINSLFSIRALKINLWHGFPLKKIGTYVEPRFIKSIQIGNWNKNILLCTSNFSQEILGKAFVRTKEECIIGMYPRNHYILNEKFEVLKEEEKILQKIKGFKKQRKKIIFYLPTFRDNRKIEFLGVKTKKERKEFFKFIKENNYVFITKLHFAGKVFHNENIETEEQDYINIPQEVDVYPIIKKTDILITDYSSIYFDFLYLNRDIIFFPYDLEYYKNEDRGLIFDYDEMTPGNKVFSLEELKNDLLNKKENRDSYFEERKKIKELIFEDYTIEDTIKIIKKMEKENV